MFAREQFESQDGFEEALRNWFAGQALAGLLATNENFHDERGEGWEWHARAAYSMADAMLAERCKAGAA